MGSESELRARFQEFVALPFPENSDDETLSEIFFSLASYDSYIAGYITRIIAGEYIDPQKLALDTELRDSLRSLNHEPQSHPDAVTYKQYFERLEELVHLATKENNRQRR